MHGTGYEYLHNAYGIERKYRFPLSMLLILVLFAIFQDMGLPFWVGIPVAGWCLYRAHLQDIEDIARCK